MLCCKSLVGLLLVTLVSAGAGSAQGAVILDQSVLINQGFFAQFGPGAGIAQSFRQAHDNIARASVRLDPNGLGVGNVTISLYDNLPTLGGNLMASATAFNVTAGDLATVDFGPISLIPEALYYLVFSGTNPNMGVSSTDGLNTGIDLYLRGQAYHSNYTLIPRNDINFQTFYFMPDVEEVPEPSSLVLALTALGAITTRRRARQWLRRIG